MELKLEGKLKKKSVIGVKLGQKVRRGLGSNRLTRLDWHFFLALNEAPPAGLASRI
jgi:hypothetical protein